MIYKLHFILVNTTVSVTYYVIPRLSLEILRAMGLSLPILVPILGHYEHALFLFDLYVQFIIILLSQDIQVGHYVSGYSITVAEHAVVDAASYQFVICLIGYSALAACVRTQYVISIAALVAGVVSSVKTGDPLGTLQLLNAT